MTFWLVYGVLMVVQFFRHRIQSAKALCAGLVIGIIHAITYQSFDFASYEPILFYAAMFLIAFAWFGILEYAKLNTSAIVCSGLVFFQMVMCFAAINADIMDSVAYGIYPSIIFIINILMILAGLGERDDMATASADSPCHRKGDDSSKGHV